MEGKMKTLVKSKAGPGLELMEREIPRIGPTDLLVKVKTTSICGTDVHIYRWDAWSQSRIKPPLIIGHEFAGEVVEIGSMVQGFSIGDYISAESHIPCGYCYQCRNDQLHICGNLKILGVDTQGCFAEYVALPMVCAWKNDKNLPPEIASIQEPLGNAVYAVLCEEVSGLNLAIFGCGPAGLFSVGVARASGAGQIFHIIKHEARRSISHKMGADEILKHDDPELVDKIIQSTKGVGVDVVVEMTGNQQAIQQGIEILRKGGRFTAFGIAPDKIKLDLNTLIFKGARLICINGREMFRTWYKMAALVNSGQLDPSPVITHKFRLEEYEQAFNTMMAPERQCGKIVFVP